MLDFVPVILMVALGVSRLISTLLLKLGKLKPGSFGASETPLGGLLMAIGFLGVGLLWVGLLWVIVAFEESAVIGYRLPILAQIVILLMMVGFFVGVWIERRARKARKAREARSEANG